MKVSSFYEFKKEWLPRQLYEEIRYESMESVNYIEKLDPSLLHKWRRFFSHTLHGHVDFCGFTCLFP